MKLITDATGKVERAHIHDLIQSCKAAYSEGSILTLDDLRTIERMCHQLDVQDAEIRDAKDVLRDAARYRHVQSDIARACTAAGIGSNEDESKLADKIEELRKNLSKAQSDVLVERSKAEDKNRELKRDLGWLARMINQASVREVVDRVWGTGEADAAVRKAFGEAPILNKPPSAMFVRAAYVHEAINLIDQNGIDTIQVVLSVLKKATLHAVEIDGEPGGWSQGLMALCRQHGWRDEDKENGCDWLDFINDKFEAAAKFNDGVQDACFRSDHKHHDTVAKARDAAEAKLAAITKRLDELTANVVIFTEIDGPVIHKECRDWVVRDLRTLLTDTPADMQTVAALVPRLRFDHKYEPGAFSVCKRCGASHGEHKAFEAQELNRVTQEVTPEIKDRATAMAGGPVAPGITRTTFDANALDLSAAYPTTPIGWLNLIDLTLRVPAAEYVPAIRDAFMYIDKARLAFAHAKFEAPLNLMMVAFTNSELKCAHKACSEYAEARRQAKKQTSIIDGIVERLAEMIKLRGA